MKTHLLFFKVKLLVCFAVLISTITYAQDPPQYGTPFSGVPDPRDVSIYEVNMRCFSPSRDFQGVIDRLDSIKALGVNVIYLMPVYPVGTLNAFNSPYCIQDYYSVGSEFGTLTDLRNLIDGAHNRGMAVILDWVANHTSWDNAWITDHKSWYLQDGSGNILTPPGQPWTDVAQLNFSNDTMRSTMIDAMRFWVFTANCDGFRCDYANGPPANFWSQAISSLRSITTHKLLLFAEGDGGALYTSGFDYTFSWNFYNNIKLIKKGSSATLIDNSNSVDYSGATGTKQVVRWLSNHDVYGSDSSAFIVFGGKAFTMAAFVVTAYMKSVPFIYNGMEVGNTVAMPFPFTSTVINWTEDASVTPEMTKIITFRDSSIAIRRGALTSYDNADVCAFKKVTETESVVVFVNLRNAEKNFTLPSGIANKTLNDAFTNASVSLGSSITLSAYEYKVYKTNESLTSVNDLTSNPSIVSPNPSEDGLIHINLAGAISNAEVNVFDVQGRNVYETVLSSSVNTLDLSGLTKGLYIVNINSYNQVVNQKLIIK